MYKQSLVYKQFLHNYSKIAVYSPFCFLLGLIPYKILRIFDLEPLQKIGLGAFFFFLVVLSLRGIVEFFFNTAPVQFFLFHMLRFEEYLRSRSFWFQCYLALTIGFSLGGWPHLSPDPYTTYALMIFLGGLYINLRHIFLDPSFEGSAYTEQSLESTGLTWDDVVRNMNGVCMALFKAPVLNKLGDYYSRQTFPTLAKRYMGSGFSRVMRAHPDVTVGLSAVGAGVGFVLGEAHADRRHRDTEANAERRHQEAVAAQREANRIAERQAEATEESNRIAASNLKPVVGATPDSSPVQAPSLSQEQGFLDLLARLCRTFF